MSELLPHLSTVADDLCIIKSTHTDAINHDPGKTLFLHRIGDPRQGEHGRVVELRAGQHEQEPARLRRADSAFWTGGTGNVQALYSRLWGSGFLPSKHQGVSFQASGDPVLFLSNPEGGQPRQPPTDARRS